MIDIVEQSSRRFFLPRDTAFVFGEVGTEKSYVEIGPASPIFINFFRFDEAYLQMFLERLRRGLLHRDDRLEVQDILYRPLTIKVYNIQEATTEAALKKSSPIIDSCLFEFSYLKNIPLVLEEEWPRRQPRVKPFQFGEAISGNQLALPHVNFNSDTTRFYQRGMSTDDPVNQFLSFYQVLEYHFVAVADEQLYNKLSRRINDPKFTTTPAHLNRLIQDTLDHKRETDETEMLKLVLSKFVDESELIEFIKAYETYVNDSLFTKKRSIFGEEVEVKLASSHVVGNIAKRIKIIRNALVHSSDRHERKERYIPNASSENMIKRELPLMKFLAERVIIASAK
jgi:hypothetical protein